MTDVEGLDDCSETAADSVENVAVTTAKVLADVGEKTSPVDLTIKVEDLAGDENEELSADLEVMDDPDDTEGIVASVDVEDVAACPVERLDVSGVEVSAMEGPDSSAVANVVTSPSEATLASSELSHFVVVDLLPLVSVFDMVVHSQ